MNLWVTTSKKTNNSMLGKQKLQIFNKIIGIFSKIIPHNFESDKTRRKYQFPISLWWWIIGMGIFPQLMTQGRNWWVGRMGNCPPSFWQNRRSRRPAAARHIMPHYWLPTQYLVASYAPDQYARNYFFTTKLSSPPANSI